MSVVELGNRILEEKPVGEIISVTEQSSEAIEVPIGKLVVVEVPKVIAAQFVAGIPSKFGLTTSLPYPKLECNDVEVVQNGVKVSWKNPRNESVTESAFTPWSNVVYVRFEGKKLEL